MSPQVAIPTTDPAGYREGMNRGLAIAAAALVVLSLSACTEIGAIGEQTAIDLALGGLENSLTSDYGVTAVASKQMDAEYHFSVTVTIDRVPVAKRADVITAVDEVLGGSAFGSASARLAIGPDDVPVYSQSVFGEDTLAGDLDYWAAVEDAVGPVSFGIFEDPDGDGPLTRARNIYRETDLDYSALAGLSLDVTALDSWGSLGVSAMGGLPSTEVADVLAVLTETIPLRDYAELDQATSIALDWSPGTATWYLVSSSLDYDLEDPETLATTDPAASADWPIAVAAASRVAGAGIPPSHFLYSSSEGLGGIVWLGECSAETQANDGDRLLFAALQTAGVDMPNGSAPGWCSGG